MGRSCSCIRHASDQARAYRSTARFKFPEASSAVGAGECFPAARRSSRIVAWDDTAVWFEHRVTRGGDLAATGIAKMMVREGHKHVEPARIAVLLGMEVPPAPATPLAVERMEAFAAALPPCGRRGPGGTSCLRPLRHAMPLPRLLPGSAASVPPKESTATTARLAVG